MMLLIALALLLAPLVAQPLGLIPRVKWNALVTSNNVRLIQLQPRAVSEAHGQSHKGRYAQERVENWLDYAGMSLCGLIAALIAAAFDSSFAIPAAAIGFALGRALIATSAFRRQTELIGHPVETLVAAEEGHPFEPYFAREARDTFSGPSYKHLLRKNETLAQFAAAMRRRLPVARLLLALQRRALRGVV